MERKFLLLMMLEIQIDKLIRSKRKTISLVVNEDATLVVRAPLRASIEYIKNLVFEKRFWINEKKLQAHKDGSARRKEYVDGEEFLFFGENFKLKISNCKQITLSDHLFFPKKYLKNPREKMVKWYKSKALEIINESAEFYSKKTGWNYKSIKINGAQKRWGSCNTKNSMNFTWRLIMAPIEVIDYVVVHELAHTQQKNHSKKFWNNVKNVLPNYKQNTLWLKQNRKFLNL